nr:pirin family protein [uncultured Flavobacterium sp.]
MLIKIDETAMMGRGPIRVLYPGLNISTNDTGIGSIGRIDHAHFIGNQIVPMHQHVNDEILSYFRSGKTEHRDSESIVEFIGKNKLMLMKAGHSFYHEEKMIDEGEPMEGLQIFIRPRVKDLNPEVLFLDLDETYSQNKWRLLASPTSETKFQFSSQTWIYDMKLSKNNVIQLPKISSDNLIFLLYVFKGSATINNTIFLNKKESLVIQNEDVLITTDSETEVVLFVTNENADYFENGMFSGNKMN